MGYIFAKQGQFYVESQLKMCLLRDKNSNTLHLGIYSDSKLHNASQIY